MLNDAGKVQAQKVVDSNQMTQAMLHYPCGFQASRSKLRDVAVVKPKGVGVLTSETSENLRLSWQEIWNHMYRPRIDPVWKKTIPTWAERCVKLKRRCQTVVPL